MCRYCTPFRLWILCLSEECYSIITALRLPHVVPVQLSELELDDPELAAAKHDRSHIEYFFTCTPALMSWVFKKDQSIDVLTYLDADLYFFGNPSFLFQEFVDFSTLITPHRFSQQNAELRRFGIYNVGWVSFRRDGDGFNCLRWWRQSCIEWCYAMVQNGRYGDQKYLDEFPKRFSRVQIAAHPGVNVAPWNLDNYVLSLGPEGAPEVDGRPVIFFHFHGLRRITSFLWRTAHDDYGAPLGKDVRSWIYGPYFAELAAARREISGHLPRPERARRNAVPRPPRGVSGLTFGARLRAAARSKKIWVLMNRVL
jgi:hypothetical protein